MRFLKTGFLLAVGLLTASSAVPQDYSESGAEKGWSMEQDHSARWYLNQNNRLNAAFRKLLPQRPKVVDAYVVVVGLDDDAVFGRETMETAKVLSRRFGAEGRTIHLITGKDSDTAQGSPNNIAATLAAVAAKMDVKEDVLILYTTSHGRDDLGIVYKDDSNGRIPNSAGAIAPARLASWLKELNIERRLLIISACYSGVFVPALESKNSIILTAASSKRSSFGCSPGNDWTFFGDALINSAFRKPQPLDKAVEEAHGLITGWELSRGLTPSDPQANIGSEAKSWLNALEARMPKDTTAKVGRPAVEG
jgi:Peptidase C13 family